MYGLGLKGHFGLEDQSSLPGSLLATEFPLGHNSRESLPARIICGRVIMSPDHGVS